MSIATAAASSLPSQAKPTRVECYRTVAKVELQAHLFLPTTANCQTAILFFFGGGWNSGTPAQFYPQAAAAAELGALAICFEYRVRSRHQTTPFDSVADAKAAIRWVRQNADRLDVRPDRIVAGGGSAGGHLAAACAFLPVEEASGAPHVSCLPDALLLFNPVLDTTNLRFAAAPLGTRCEELSPLHHVRPGSPPTIIFHGTADVTVPFADAEQFRAAMQAVGNPCELIAYPGLKHGFFNPGKTPDVAAEVWAQAVRFLGDHGLLPTAGLATRSRPKPVAGAEQMTPRQRWLAALRCQPVDRLPFWPKLGGAYVGAQQGQFAGQTFEQLHQWIGSDLHAGVGNGLADRHRACAYDSSRQGDAMVEQFVTPNGTLTRRQQFDPGSQSWHPMAMPVESCEQIKLMTDWYADLAPAIDEPALDQAQARCGELGETACTMAGIGESALMTFVEHLAGPLNAQYLLADHPAEVEALFAAMHRHLRRRMELAAEHTPADTLYLIENTSTTLISPEQYRRYCLPHLREYADLARAHNRLLVLHMCGHLKALLPDLATLPVAGFEAFTSPTVGNTTLVDGRRHCPNICLIGGTNAALWLRPAADIIAALADQFRQLPHLRGLVITSAGVMPPAASPATIREVRNFVANQVA